MSTKFTISYVVSFISLVFAWVAVVLLSNGSFYAWAMDIWLPVLGLFWSFDYWIYPMTPLDFWEDKEIRNGIFTALATSMLMALSFMAVVKILS